MAAETLTCSTCKLPAAKDDKLTFFRQARQTAGDGRFTWTVVRACVRESESEVDVSGKYLPMAVHLKDGWTEQQVMAKQARRTPSWELFKTRRRVGVDGFLNFGLRRQTKC